MIDKFSAAIDSTLDHPRWWVAVLSATFATTAGLKYVAISILYARGVRGVPLRVQDSILDGAFAVIVTWLIFVLLRERRRQVQRNLQAIAELHERLQNVLYAVVEIKDEACDEDIAAFLHTLDTTASTLRGLLRSHADPVLR